MMVANPIPNDLNLRSSRDSIIAMLIGEVSVKLMRLPKKMKALKKYILRKLVPVIMIIADTSAHPAAYIDMHSLV